MEDSNRSRKSEFTRLAESYKHELCMMYDFSEGCCWYDQTTSVLFIDDMDYIVNFEDVRLLVDEKVPFEVFEGWYKQSKVNLRTWWLMHKSVK
jgi:hypothetical protein